jgi:4-carboxymuconolactone decarboxylase
MSRVPDVTPDTYTPEQKRVADEIGKLRRGLARGPYAIWIRIPEVAELASKLGNMIRLKSKLERRLFELMVLIVARTWSAQFEWFAHEPYGHEFGIEADVIEALRAGRVPSFKREEEQIVYDTIIELQAKRALSQASFDRAHAKLGLQPLIELIAGAGYATMLAMTLRTFEVPAPDGKRPLPDLA